MIFLQNVKGLAPSDVDHCDTNSITGGKTKHKAVEQRAPISDMKTLSFGTNSAIATARNKVDYD